MTTTSSSPLTMRHTNSFAPLQQTSTDDNTSGDDSGGMSDDDSSNNEEQKRLTILRKAEELIEEVIRNTDQMCRKMFKNIANGLPVRNRVEQMKRSSKIDEQTMSMSSSLFPYSLICAPLSTLS